MEKFICSFGMGTPLAGKYLEVEAHDIEHCSDILGDQNFLQVVASIYPEAQGMELVKKYNWHKLPNGSKAPYANLDRVDWRAFQKQKDVLQFLMNDRSSLTEEQQEALGGVLGTYDRIQGEAALALGVETVFRKVEE